jgi:hypothetical protein
VAEASRLLAQRNYAALRSHSGVAPVTKRSGKSVNISMRYSCSNRLRQACYHLSRVSLANDPPAHAYYKGHRARGHTLGHALRALGDRWLRVLMAMLRKKTCYVATAGPTEQAA